jgi:hypothetical protein
MLMFTFPIEARTAKCGDSHAQERAFVVEMLRRAVQQIGNGSKPWSGQNVVEPSAVNVSNCSYAFGPGSLNGGL